MQCLTINAGDTRTLVLHGVADGIADWDIVQHAGSNLTIQLIVLDGCSGNATIRVRQAGAHCTTRIFGIALLHGNQQVNVRTFVEHASAHGTSRQLLKFVLTDHARGDFYGVVKVNPDAILTDAQQSNRNILISDYAHMRTRPQLEIYADDVQCSHGATTGQLDESVLFYMQQRGIDPATARKMLLAAFFHDVIASLDSDALRADVEKQINRLL